MKLPNYVKQAIKLLEDNNYEVYVVGGAVRDYLLGKNPKDYDLSTNATPIEVKKVFQDYFVIDTGIKYGTVSVMIEKHLIEITTYREEEAYLDYRRPSKITFKKTINSDLSRRDFTINAICFNKTYLDLFSGISDLKNKVIKAIGNPDDRFTEDPLRILRAIRFSSTLSFSIEENTNKSLKMLASLLDKVSKERINIELTKMLLGENIKRVMCEYKDILEDYVFKFKLNQDYINVIDKVEDKLANRLSLLCLDLTPQDVNDKLRELKYPNKVIKEVINVISNYHKNIECNEISLLNALKTIDYETFGIILNIKNSLSNDYENHINLYKSLKSKVLRINNLKINGNDLKKIGFNEGVEIKKVLERLLDDVISGLPNEHNCLMKRASEYFIKGLGVDYEYEYRKNSQA